jgi:predicted type IV restriction endonuclease
MLKETLDFIRKNISFWQANNLNEAQTCQSIILGILYELKYDIWNPFEIFPQDTNTRGAGRPDYLICLNDQEKFVIEVKALNKDFSDAEYTQAVNYVNAKGLRWAILTNGIKWLFFDNLIKGTIKQKLV